VNGEDPATPGLLKGIDPGTVTIPQYRVNKTKQHTHTPLKSCCDFDSRDYSESDLLRPWRGGKNSAKNSKSASESKSKGKRKSESQRARRAKEKENR